MMRNRNYKEQEIIGIHQCECGFKLLSRSSISILFFLECSIFSESIKFFLDLSVVNPFCLQSQLSRLLMSSMRFSNMAESALLRSLQSVEVSSFFWYLLRKSWKNSVISCQTSLQLSILRSESIMNSCRKYLTLMSLLRPRAEGSKWKRMLCCVRQLASESSQNYSSSRMSSPRSRIHFSRVSGTYSQQKQNSPEPSFSQWRSLIRNSFSRVDRNCTIFLMIYSCPALWYTNFLRTRTPSVPWAAYLSSPKGQVSCISTMVHSAGVSLLIAIIIQVMCPMAMRWIKGRKWVVNISGIQFDHSWQFTRTESPGWASIRKGQNSFCSILSLSG